MLETLRIRDIREDNNLTQKRISEILNCTQQTYSRYETGEITIDIFNLIKLAKYYKTSTAFSQINLSASFVAST